MCKGHKNVALLTCPKELQSIMPLDRADSAWSQVMVWMRRCRVSDVFSDYIVVVFWTLVLQYRKISGQRVCMHVEAT